LPSPQPVTVIVPQPSVVDEIPIQEVAAAPLEEQIQPIVSQDAGAPVVAEVASGPVGSNILEPPVSLPESGTDTLRSITNIVVALSCLAFNFM